MDWQTLLQNVVLVLLGFSLGEGTRFIRDKRQETRARKFITQELETNRAMIPQRIDNLKKMQDAARTQQILPANGVHFMTLAYEQEAARVFQQLTQLERDNLHFFYQYFKRTDEFMATYAERVLDMKRSGINDPFPALVGIIGDFIAQLERASQMIEEFLQKKPRDVLYRRTASPEPGHYL